MSKQTALEWLMEKIQLSDVIIPPSGDNSYVVLFPNLKIKDIEQAKEMEKQQIIDAYVHGCDDTYGIDEPNANPNYDRKEAEQYYNKTYKQDNE